MCKCALYSRYVMSCTWYIRCNIDPLDWGSWDGARSCLRHSGIVLATIGDPDRAEQPPATAEQQLLQQPLSTPVDSTVASSPTSLIHPGWGTIHHPQHHQRTDQIQLRSCLPHIRTRHGGLQTPPGSPERDPYSTLKDQLIQHTAASKQHIQQLLTTEELGNWKPTQLLHIGIWQHAACETGLSCRRFIQGTLALFRAKMKLVWTLVITTHSLVSCQVLSPELSVDATGIWLGPLAVLLNAAGHPVSRQLQTSIELYCTVIVLMRSRSSLCFIHSMHAYPDYNIYISIFDSLWNWKQLYMYRAI